jgi:hypothetical protein
MSEPIKGADRDCEYCGEPLHYGWCEGLHTARKEAIRTGRPRPVPIVRTGP